jgi:hypothetical protein
MQVNIGFDLDNTIAYPVVPFWDIVSSVLGVKNPGANHNYTISEVYNREFTDACFRLFSTEWYTCRNMKPVSGINYLFSYLKNSMDCKIRIISARPECIRGATNKFIEDNFNIEFIDSYDYVGIREDKISLFNKYHLDVWVDDNPKDVIDANNHNITTFLIKQAWNRRMRDINNPNKHYELYSVLELKNYFPISEGA